MMVLSWEEEAIVSWKSSSPKTVPSAFSRIVMSASNVYSLESWLSVSTLIGPS